MQNSVYLDRNIDYKSPLRYLPSAGAKEILEGKTNSVCQMHIFHNLFLYNYVVTEKVSCLKPHKVSIHTSAFRSSYMSHS